MRQAKLQKQFFEDLTYWVEKNPKMAKRLLRIMKEVLSHPTTGIGKPEPLKHKGPDIWSRRLDQVHRVVYRISDDVIDFLQGRYHYD